MLKYIKSREINKFNLSRSAAELGTALKLNSVLSTAFLAILAVTF